MIDAGELSELININIREARTIIRLIQEEMKKKGLYVPKSKKLIAPTELVMERIGVNGINSKDQ